VDDRSDGEVIAASMHDPAAFGVIFDRHATALRRYLVRRLGPDDAASILGEVFRIAFERRSSYDLERPHARPWLYGIATNLVAKERRGETRRLHAIARLKARHEHAPDLADAVTAAVDASNLWDRVAAAVAALPDGERDALVLSVWEGLAYDEVAAALDIPIGTVRSRINRARGRLRELAAPSGEQHIDTTKGTAPGRIGS